MNDLAKTSGENLSPAARTPNLLSMWRSDMGGKPVIVVDVDPPFVTVKPADSSKKDLANPKGGQITTLSEMQAWTEIKT